MNARNSRNAPAAGRNRKRGGGPRALAVSLNKIARQALKNRNLAERSLIVDWLSIAGTDTARICHPLGLSFARRDRRMDGTLSLRVQSGQALRVQHLEPQLIERINGYFGYRAVARLRLEPGPPPAVKRAGKEAPEPAPRPSRAAESGHGISDPALKAALARLGRTFKPSS